MRNVFPLDSELTLVTICFTPHLLPQKDLIVLDDIHRVFAVDALASSRPLSSKEEDITRPEQISEVFDTISYSKVNISNILIYIHTIWKKV